MARKKLQKLFALLLTASMTMSLLSIGALAVEPGGSDPGTSAEEQIAAAHAAHGELTEGLAQAQSALETAQSAYDAAVAAVDAGEVGIAYADAQAVAAEKTGDLKTATADKEKADAELAAAEAALAALKEAEEPDAEAIGEAETAVEEAQIKATAAADAYAAANTAKTDADLALATAEEAYRAAVSALPETAALAEANTTVEAAQADYDEAVTAEAAIADTAIAAIADSGFEFNHKDKTEEQIQAVKNARAVYDLLCAEAQAKVSQYETLMEAEELAKAYSVPTTSKWDVDQSISDWVDTSGWIDFNPTAIHNNRDTQIDYTIVNTYHALEDGELISGDQAVNVPVAYAWNQGRQLPGNKTMAVMTITNQSDHYFAYKSGSAYFGLDDLESYGIQEGTIGFTGDPIAYGSGIHNFKRCENPALKALNLSNLKDTTLYSALEEKGYTGEGALARYYLDFYNDFYHTNYTKLDDFSTEQQVQMFGASRYSSVSETDPEVLQCMYNFFYNEFFRAGLTEFDATNIPSAENSYGIGQYMDKQGQAYLTLDSALEDAIGLLAPGETVTLPAIYIGLMGKEMNNVHANASFSYQFYFYLEQADSDVTITKTDEEGNQISGARFKLYQLDENGDKVYYAVSQEGETWTEAETDAAVLELGSVTLEKLPFGTYYLTEISAPAGYESLGEDVAFTVDRTEMTVNVANQPIGSDDGKDDDNDPRPPRDPDEGEDIPDEDTPTTDIPDIDTPTTDVPDEETPTTDIPEEETPLADVPKTGDVTALWLAMTALSGTGLAGVTFLGRKKKEQ